MPNVGHAYGLIERLVREPGFEYFNSSKAEVQTLPFHTAYNVMYHFVRTPFEYRLEIMHPLYQESGRGGFSPLHAAMWRPNGAPQGDNARAYPIVHMSYKVPDVAAYEQEVLWMQNVHAMAGMYCRSDYGHFSYWLPPHAENLVWLKPRVNTRDAG